MEVHHQEAIEQFVRLQQSDETILRHPMRILIY